MSLQLLFVILFTVALSACAQLALKLGVTSGKVISSIDEHARGFELLWSVITTPMIWLGLFIYGFSVVLWLWVLSKTELSVAYPFVGISFIITMVFGAFILNEGVTPMRIAGTVLVSLGCVLIGRSA